MTISMPTLTRPEAIQTAQRMHATGWSVNQIRDYLAGRGQAAAWTTVKCWVDDDFAAKRRAKLRATQREWWRRTHGAVPRYPEVTVEEKWQRFCELRAAGLSQRDVAIVLRLDYGDDLTTGQVRYAERQGYYPGAGPGSGCHRAGGRPRKAVA